MSITSLDGAAGLKLMIDCFPFIQMRDVYGSLTGREQGKNAGALECGQAPAIEAAFA